MKKFFYISIFILISQLSIGQNKLYKKAYKAYYSEHNIEKAKGLILNIKKSEKLTDLAVVIETEYLRLANESLPKNTNLSLNYFNEAKTVGLLIRDSLWSPQQTETGLNIAYALKENCEHHSDSNSVCYYKSKTIYESILAQDQFNWSANYNLGAMLYHRAVYKIKQLDYETDIFVVEEIQDECIKLFFTALPYLKKAYELNPQEKIIAKSLSELYLSLNDEKKAKEFEKKAH